MDQPMHAITVAPASHGWAWELIDCEGATAAAGISADQADAISSAWQAAKSYSNGSGAIAGAAVDFDRPSRPALMRPA